MFALLRKAYRDVTKRRVRSLLTVMGIVVGVAGIVAIISTGQNLTAAQAAAYANASQADISFWVWDAQPSTERAIESLDNITAAELREDWYTRCRWPAGSESQDQTARDVFVHGVQDFANMRVDQVLFKSGRFPDQGEFVAEESAVEAAPLHLGDTITCRARPPGRDRQLKLVGIVRTPN